jgi:RHS repeat-associated protein
VTTPNGTLVSYTRNALGQIASIQVTPSGGAVTTVVSNVVHMPFGPVSSYTLGNGQAVTLTYDANGAWTDVASSAFSLHVKRDVAGNITAIGNTAGVATPTEIYSYDPLYRLTGVNAADGSSIEAYTYNKTGDRLSKAAPGLLTGIYNYATGSHHLTGVGTTTRVVDARGNTTADVLASGTYGYGYNGRNRLTVVQNGGATVGSYVLNALGQRVQKTAGGLTTRFDYDEDSHLLSESAGTTTRDYIWMDDVPVGIVDHTGSATAVNFIHADGLGSPRAVTSSTGSVLWQWAYAGNPFGEKAPVSSTGYTLNLRFPGQYFDGESGLSYNVHRDFEAASGRYLQSDPLGISAGTSTYSYVRGNPLTGIDPLGLCDEDDRCRKVKADGIEECSGTFPNGRMNQSMIFFNCLNAYLEAHGCGPGGKPLPQPEETPEPSRPKFDDETARRAAQAGEAAAGAAALARILTWLLLLE